MKLQIRTRELLTDLLVAHYNSLMSEYYYLTHQRTLIEEHRKVEADDSTISILIENLRFESKKAEEAMNELQIKIPR